MQNVDIKQDESTLVIRRSIPASTEAVFKAFTDPEVMCRWMGPGDHECVAVDIDLKPGGRYRIHMRGEDGDHVALGEYLDIVPNQRLKFSWSWETGYVKDTVVTVTFESNGEKTDLELTHEQLPDPDAAAKHGEGWNGCLDKLHALPLS